MIKTFKLSKVIIIGSGIAGIASAIRLRLQGFEVEVYESNYTYGGKIRLYQWEGYRFDTGPSLFTLPHLVDELFQLAGKNPRDYFNYHKLSTVTRYFYENGNVIDSFSDAAKFANEVEQKLNINSKIITNFLTLQRKTYQLLAPIFIEKPIHIFIRLFKWKNIPALIHLMHPRFLKTLHNENSKWFKNMDLTMLFDRYGTYNGSNPYKMPSLFNIISHLEHNEGAYLPDKGMYAVSESLFNLSLELGVKYHFNSKVQKINVNKNKAVGIEVNNSMIPADIIISNMDVNLTYSNLLANQKQPNIFLKNEKSTSALIFHWAINSQFPNLDVHNILFSGNYEQEFKHLFELKSIYDDPTVYIYISSKNNNADAPEGCENWFVMINVPHLKNDSDSELDINFIRNIIFEKINKTLGTEMKNYIENEHITTPIDLQNVTNSYLGSLYGASSNSMLSAFVRHPNFASIKNLFFVGGTVHPGGGVPLCLLSAKITSELIQEGYNVAL